jgi:hypothetical protein
VTPDIVIRKQKIKISTSNEQLALHVRKQLSDSLQYDLIALLDRVFAKHASSNAYINIDKIKIDLGRVSVKDFEKHFLEFAEPKLASELQKKLDEINRPDQKNTFYSDASYQSSNSLTQQETNALFYFLKNGNYPWWYNKDTLQTPAELLNKFNEEELQSLLLKIISTGKNQNDEAQKIVRRLFIHLPGEKNNSIIDYILALFNNDTLKNNIRVLIQNSNELLKLFSITIKEFYEQLTLFLISKNSEEEKNTIYNFLAQLKNAFGISESKLNVYPNQFSDELKRALANDVKQENVDNRKREKQTTEFEKGIYISNAGLILLHPFLKSFFTETGLLNDQNNFISVEAQQKAAVLLYYLQGCDENYKEWEMALNKIICGIALDEVVVDGIVISDEEKEEAKNLLRSVAGYWEALKGASLEALQNTFLLREGKITWKKDYWLLQVERSGVDILLERLPWSFSTVKFPWLNNLIYTEW